MRKDNILQFPIFSNDRDESERKVYPEQLDLFARGYCKVSAIVFISIENVGQHALLDSLTRHSIKTVIDLRSRPVFPKPRFDHKYVMSYFYKRSMNYIECAMSRSNVFEVHSVNRPTHYDRLDRWMSSEAPVGITACIIDNFAIEAGIVAMFRHRVAGMLNRHFPDALQEKAD